MHWLTRILVGGLAATLAAPAFTQDKPPRLFDVEDELTLTLEGPWRRIQREHERETRRYPAVLRYTDVAGQPASLEVEVEPRGNSRRYQICDMPPLWLHLPEARRDTRFRGQRRVRMVGWCDRGERYEQYNVKEFLAYRVYNQLTPLSIRVRGATVTFVDNVATLSPELVRFAFFIEDVDDAAERNGLVELDTPEIAPSRLEPGQASLLALYQYLIGNLDWAATGGPSGENCCHNGKLVGTSLDDPLFVLPYDFDSAGIVDAHYAAPPDIIRGVRRVTDRRFRGFCVHNDTLPAARATVLAEREAILALVRTETRLVEREREDTLEFLQEGFDVLADDEAFAEEIVGRCRS